MLFIALAADAGLSLFATIERLSDGFFWDNVALDFPGATPTGDSRVPLTEGTGELAKSYSAAVDSLGDPGFIRIRVHDDADPADAVISGGETYVWGGDEILPGDVRRINGGLTNANEATLSLKMLNVVNDAGTAVLAQSTGGNGVGINCIGHGTGQGGRFQAGATSTGLSLVAGSSFGVALGLSAVNGSCISAETITGTCVNLTCDTGTCVFIHTDISGQALIVRGTGAFGHAVQFQATGSGGHALNLIGGSGGDDLRLASSAAPTLMAAAFINDTGWVYADSVPGSVVREITAGAGGVEPGITFQDAMKVILAAVAGKLSGAGTGTVAIRDTNDTLDRIVATVDSIGNRLTVTLDLS